MKYRVLFLSIVGGALAATITTAMYKYSHPLADRSEGISVSDPSAHKRSGEGVYCVIIPWNEKGAEVVVVSGPMKGMSGTIQDTHFPESEAAGAKWKKTTVFITGHGGRPGIDDYMVERKDVRLVIPLHDKE